MTFFFYIRLSCVFSVVLCCVNYCSNQKGQDRAYVTIFENQIVDHVKLRSLFPESFFLSSVFLETDVPCDKDELFYLMNIKEGVMITKDEILFGIERCVKKDRFLSLQLYVQSSNQGINLFIKVIGRYLVKQIKIKGIWHDLDSFKRLYQYQKFEPFHEDKHRQGITAIEHYLHAEGYCGAIVRDNIIYDHAQKFVTILLHITPAKRFNIESVFLQCDDTCREHTILMRELFYLYCSSKLISLDYTHDRLNKVFSSFVEQLRFHGFLCSDLLCKEIIEKEHHRVCLYVSVNKTFDKRIIFQGNNFFSTEQLFNHLHTIFKNERCITSDVVREAITSLYMAHGFFHVSIIEEDASFEIKYTIIERNRAIVSDVVVSLYSIPDNIKEKYQLFLLQQMIGLPVNEITMAHILERCVHELIYDGFLGAKVVESRYEKSENGDVVLHIIIDGGKQVYVHDIIIRTDQHVVGITANLFKPEKKTLIRVNMLSMQRDHLLFLLHNAGYLHATVSPEVVERDDTAILIWHVVAGKRVHFGKLIILGNPMISFSRVLKNIAFQSGELWQQNLIQQSLENLQKLSIYEQVELYPELYTMNEKHELFLRLIPDDPFEVRLRAGTELQYIQDYQSFGGITYKMGGSLIAKNRLRFADTTQLDADFAGSHREVLLSYNVPISQPGFVRLPFAHVWNVKVQAYHMRYEQPGVIGYPKNIYTVGRDGILCALCATKNTSYINLSWGFEAQKTTIKNRRYADVIALLINFDHYLLGKEIPYLFFETNCLFDFLDDKIYPTRGVSSLISLKCMLPCHDKSRYFAKLLCEETFFLSFLTCTLGLRFRLGYMFHKDFSKISPIERFYLGGSHSVRGYEADLFPPTSPLIDDSGKVVYIPRGGKIMININTELRKRVISYITIALFHDIGALADNIEAVNAMLPLHTSGFGLRFDTPFGPLRFDIGWKWTLTQPEERRYAWYLSFGRSF